MISALFSLMFIYILINKVLAAHGGLVNNKELEAKLLEFIKPPMVAEFRKSEVKNTIPDSVYASIVQKYFQKAKEEGHCEEEGEVSWYFSTFLLTCHTSSSQALWFRPFGRLF